MRTYTDPGVNEHPTEPPTKVVRFYDFKVYYEAQKRRDDGDS
jgi:hypothetical protein